MANVGKDDISGHKGPTVKSKSLRPKDPLSVDNMDPNYAYRWLSKPRLEESGGEDHRGFKVVRETRNSGEETKEIGKLVETESLDSAKRFGTLVLGRLPNEDAEVLREATRRQNDIRKEIMNAKSQGAKVEFDSRRGHKVIKE